MLTKVSAEGKKPNHERLARELTQEAMDVSREGIRKHYYDESDVAHHKVLAEHAPVKIN